jgi:type II secretory ATPase GspE/PulE/Tfp pilus assembly ATPase PilB-like protein
LLRACHLLLIVVAIVLLGAQSALAAGSLKDPWPDYPDGFHRGPGNYLSWFKLITCWLLFLLWVRTTDWISRDCLKLRLGYVKWNCTVFLLFVVAFVLVWFIPWFWLGFSLLLIAYAGPLAVYVRTRNSTVEQDDKVLTKAHLRHVWASRASKVGVKVEAEKKTEHELGPPVQLFADGAESEEQNQVHLIQARQSPGFFPSRELIHDAISRQAKKVMLDFTQQAVGVRYRIDGVWHNLEERDRETGDVMLAVMKTLSGLDASDRRSRQEGTIRVEAEGANYTCGVVSQGVKTGERVLLNLDDGKQFGESLEDLGMRTKMIEQVVELLGAERGFVILSGLPENGVTATADSLLERLDRYMKSFVAIEEVAKPEREIVNIEVTTYDAAAGETPATVLPKLARTYPDVYVVRDLVNAETVTMLCDEIGENRSVVTTIAAKESVEALLRVLMLKAPVAKFAPVVTGVINQRLIRKLCEHCKEAYEPTPEVLKQLGIPAGRIQQLYRHRQEVPEGEEICAHCNGIGFNGQTAIFELLLVSDPVREALAKTPKVDVLRKVAAKNGMRSLQQEGIVLVAKGATSINELLRVLKQ